MKNLFTWLVNLLRLRTSKVRKPSFVVINEVQPRFSITMGGTGRKIFTYFPAAADGSIAFHTYCEKEYSMYQSGNFVSEIIDDSTSMLSIDPDEAQRLDDFSTHKINFHKSGVFWHKNKKGEVISDEVKRTISLENFQEDSFGLCSLVPAAWEGYPIIKDNKTYIELTQGNLNVIPPIIQFYVARDEAPILEMYRTYKKTVLWFVDHQVLAKFGLKLFFTVITNGNRIYPETQIFITKMAEKQKTRHC